VHYRDTIASLGLVLIFGHLGINAGEACLLLVSGWCLEDIRLVLGRVCSCVSTGILR